MLSLNTRIQKIHSKLLVVRRTLTQTQRQISIFSKVVLYPLKSNYRMKNISGKNNMVFNKKRKLPNPGLLHSLDDSQLIKIYIVLGLTSLIHSHNLFRHFIIVSIS